MLTAIELFLQDSLNVRIYDRPVCLLTTVGLLLEDSLKVRIYDRPICLLTIEILLQDSFKVLIYNRPVYLLIMFKLLLQGNKIRKKYSILGEMQIKHTIAFTKLIQKLPKIFIGLWKFFLTIPKKILNMILQ